MEQQHTISVWKLGNRDDTGIVLSQFQYCIEARDYLDEYYPDHTVFVQKGGKVIAYREPIGYSEMNNPRPKWKFGEKKQT